MKSPPPRRLKTFWAAAAAAVLLLVAAFLALYFTILRPRQPEVVATPVNLDNIAISVFPTVQLNLTIGLDVSVENRNYAGFKYRASSAEVYYRGELVGQAAIGAGTVAARATENVSTAVEVMVERLATNPYFLTDVAAGALNFTSVTCMEGKVVFLRVFKVHAKAWISCDINVSILSKSSTSSCSSDVKL